MTKAEKKERRAVRHQLQNAAAKHLTPYLKLNSTAAQMRAHGRRVADQLFAGKNPATATPL